MLRLFYYYHIVTSIIIIINVLLSTYYILALGSALCIKSSRNPTKQPYCYLHWPEKEIKMQ